MGPIKGREFLCQLINCQLGWKNPCSKEFVFHVVVLQMSCSVLIAATFSAAASCRFSLSDLC